jgi:ATP-dependent RNA helicase DDX42
MNKGGPKKFQFGFPSKKTSTTTKATEKPLVTEKRKASEVLSDEAVKKPRSANLILDDEDEFLASAGIGKAHSCVFFLHHRSLMNFFKAKETVAVTAKDSDKEEEDPLDAFMADMDEKAKTSKAEPKVYYFFFVSNMGKTVS